MEEINIGDIIIIDSFISQNSEVSRHSFVVIEDDNGEVCGLDYDFIALIMSSFKDDTQKKKKLQFKGNFPITASSEDVKHGHGKEGYIKAEQFYYFNKSKTSYSVIGKLNEETLTSLFEFISTLPKKSINIERIIDNL